MGSFSWNKIDKLTDTENIAHGEEFKFLIPKEFGGGFIRERYQDYGYLGIKEDGEPKYDMYELLAFWNEDKIDVSLSYDGEKPLMKEIDKYTNINRVAGVNIGCSDCDMARLKYPLKLASVEFKGTYEDIKGFSLNDPDQGFYPRERKEMEPGDKVTREDAISALLNKSNYTFKVDVDYFCYIEYHNDENHNVYMNIFIRDELIGSIKIDAKDLIKGAYYVIEK